MYDEVEIEDMEWSDALGAYTYACPCGDVFQITKVGVRVWCGGGWGGGGQRRHLPRLAAVGEWQCHPPARP
jgi:hypothetical protein